jgi:hypothetical protein
MDFAAADHANVPALGRGPLGERAVALKHSKLALATGKVSTVERP